MAEARTTIILPFHGIRGQIRVTVDAIGLSPAAIAELAEVQEAVASWADQHLLIEEDDDG